MEEFDIERIRREAALWTPTMQVRWFRPAGGNDNDIHLQQLYERVTGEREWRRVPTCLEN